MNPNFQKLTKKQQERLIDYARIIFTDLKAQSENWKSYRDNRHSVRAITHGNYDRIHTLSVPSGLISLGAWEAKKKDNKFIPTKDHCYRPQFMIQMFMDKPEVFLKDFDVFLQYVIVASTTILITSDENEKLKNFTKNKNGKITIKVPTDKIYQEANIELFEFTGGSKWWQNNLKPASNYLVTPKEYLEYEEAFLE
jgi:hypothetical protein